MILVSVVFCTQICIWHCFLLGSKYVDRIEYIWMPLKKCSNGLFHNCFANSWYWILKQFYSTFPSKYVLTIKGICCLHFHNYFGKLTLVKVETCQSRVRFFRIHLGVLSLSLWLYFLVLYLNKTVGFTHNYFQQYYSWKKQYFVFIVMYKTFIVSVHLCIHIFTLFPQEQNLRILRVEL